MADSKETIFKTELVETISLDQGLTKKVVSQVMDALLDEVQRLVSEGTRVNLRGLGTLETRYAQPRDGVNPSTGAAIEIPGRHYPKFRASDTLKRAVRDSLSS